MAVLLERAGRVMVLLRDIVVVHARSVLPVGLVVILGTLLLGLLAGCYAQLIGVTVYASLVAQTTSFETLTVGVVLVMLPLLLLCVFAVLVWLGVVMHAANAAAGRQRASMPMAALSGLKRSPRALAVIAITFAAAIGSLVATPVLIVLGVIGLLVRPRRFRRADLVAMAIPFGVTVLVLVRWSLALPSVTLGGLGVRAALADSSARVRGRGPLVGLVLLSAFVVSLGISEGLVALVRLVDPSVYTESAVRILALILVGPLAFVAMVVLHRLGAVERPAVERGMPLIARTAALVIVTLVAPLTIGVTSSPAVADTGVTPVTVSVLTSPESPLPADVDTTVTVRVSNASTAEGVQPTGVVVITVDGGTPIGPSILDGGHLYQFSTTFSAGTHTVQADYFGDDTFAPGTTTATIVAGYETAVDLTAAEATAPYGAPVALTATVTTGTGSPSGDVEFSAAPAGGGAPTPIDTATLDGTGTAHLDISSLTVGSYLLVAQYLGDATHLSSWSDAVPFSVSAASTATTLVISPVSPSPAGGTLTATSTVVATNSPATPTGSIELYRDSDPTPLASGPLVGGVSTLTFVAAPGTFSLTAVYVPDTEFVQGGDSRTHTVSGFGAGVTLGADSAVSQYGEPVVLTATVAASATPTGDVRFTATPSGGSPIVLGTQTVDGSGVATFTTSGLPVGAYALVASYLGDSLVGAVDSSELTHTVTTSDVTVAVTTSAATPTYGDRVMLTATLAGAYAGIPTGTVTFTRDDGVVLGTASLSLAGVATLPNASVGDAGSRTYTATYAGDDTYRTGTGSLDLAVAPIATVTHLGGAVDRSHVYGDSQTFAGSVTTGFGPPPTGEVELWVGGSFVASGTLSSGLYSITTDRVPVGVVLSLPVSIVYLGDANHAGSTSTDPVQVEMTKAQVVPIVTIDPETAGLGGTVTVTADLGSLGAGPTGFVAFSIPGTPLGTVALVDGKASVPLTITGTSTTVTAAYLGDSNFAARSKDLTIIVDRAAVAVAIEDPGALDYGSIVTLHAFVSVAGGAITPSHGVDFHLAGQPDFASNVPVVAGVASVDVCVGDSVVCTGPEPALGIGDAEIVASYAESPTNLLGVSAPLAYAVVKAATTTTVTVDPSIVSMAGGGIHLTATVAGPNPTLVPTGSVNFYSSTAGAEFFLGSGTLTGGVASYVSSVGTGAEQLRWPADSIVARYFPAGAPYAASFGTTPVTIERVGVTVTATALPATVYAARSIQVSLAHEPGSSADFTGTVTVTADTGAACTVAVVAPAHGASCAITWDTVGPHSVTASYSGDPVYAPGTSGTTDVTVGKATPVLGASVASPVSVLSDVTVTWSLFDAAATGTVEVYGDGALWCSVPLETTSCTGQFGAGATGSVPVVVRYLGDATYNGVQDELTTTITSCIPVDVYATNPSLGSVSVSPAPNCGTGYLIGTVVTATAAPGAGNELVSWQRFGTAGLVLDTTALATTFAVTSDASAAVRAATFQVACFPISPTITGSGGIQAFPASNCTSPAGVAGWTRGTAVTVYPDPHVNPTYGELDDFYAFSALPTGVVLGTDGFGRERVRFAMNAPVTFAVEFGPRCRTVQFGAVAGLTSAVLTPVNCESPQRIGFLTGTYVQVSAATTSTSKVLTGWQVNGSPAPALARQTTPTVLVNDDTVVTPVFVDCFSVTVTIDGAQDARGRAVGDVTATTPTCPDGSARYPSGTAVTLTPNVLLADTFFTGWSDVATPTRVGTVGPVTASARTFTITKDLALTATFFYGDTCSRLSIFGRPSLISFDSTGCGDGYYFDVQKQSAIRVGAEQSTLWESKYRSILTSTISDDVPLDVYVSIRGDTRNCFGTAPLSAGPSTDIGETKTYGPLARPTDTCEVGGPLSVTVQSCQSIVGDPRFHVGGATFGPESMPNEVLLKNADGAVEPFTMTGFQWVATLSVNSDATDVEPIGPGPCKDAGNAFPSGTNVLVYGVSMADGIVFTGWPDGDGTFVAQNPVGIQTTDDARSLSFAADYDVTCHKLTLGEGISIEGPVATCPGTDPDEHLIIAGTAVRVKAVQHIGSRIVNTFRTGVLANQISVDPDTQELTAYAYMDANQHVTADYPTSGQRTAMIFAQVAKIYTGVLAIAAPIIVGMLIPPLGIALSLVGAAAGIASLIPGGDKVAAVFDLVNPVKITQCAASWGFSNEAGNPTGGPNVGSLVSTANTVRKVVQGIDVVTERVGMFGAAGGIASFGAGLYEAGVGSLDLTTPVTVEGLRGTSTMTNCLNKVWRAVDSTVGIDDGAPAAR